MTLGQTPGARDPHFHPITVTAETNLDLDALEC